MYSDQFIAKNYFQSFSISMFKATSRFVHDRFKAKEVWGQKGNPTYERVTERRKQM